MIGPGKLACYAFGFCGGARDCCAACTACVKVGDGTRVSLAGMARKESEWLKGKGIE